MAEYSVGTKIIVFETRQVGTIIKLSGVGATPNHCRYKVILEKFVYTKIQDRGYHLFWHKDLLLCTELNELLFC